MQAIPMISQQERAKREAAIRFARNSVRLEGFHLNQEAEVLNQRYVSGEITDGEHTAALLALAGLPPRR